VVQRALALDVAARFPTALAMAEALETVGVASPSEVARWVTELAGDALKRRRQAVDALEAGARDHEGAASPLSTPKPAAIGRAGNPLLPVIAFSVAGLVLAVIVVVVMSPLRVKETEAPGARPTTGDPVKEAPRPPPLPSQATAAPPEPAPTIHAQEATPAPAPNPPIKAAEPRVPARSPAPAKPSANCSPPFVIDAQGVKRFKVECLK
jgi:serine/threonine-protein kinase